jgi:hypothetical protein
MRDKHHSCSARAESLLKVNLMQDEMQFASYLHVGLGTDATGITLTIIPTLREANETTKHLIPRWRQEQFSRLLAAFRTTPHCTYVRSGCSL